MPKNITQCIHFKKCPGYGRYGITDSLNDKDTAFRRYTTMSSAGLEPVMCSRADGSFRVCYETVLKAPTPKLAKAA